MLRMPKDELERTAAEIRLRRAHALMTEALTVLDGTAVATECDAHLDLAIHTLVAAIEQVRGGARIFRDDTFEQRLGAWRDHAESPRD